MKLDKINKEILNLGQIAAVIFNNQEEIVFWSQIMEKIFGLYEEEVQGRHLKNVLPFLVQKNDKTYFDQTYCLSKQQGEMYLNKKNPVEVECKYSTLKDDEGRPIGGMICFKDILGEKEKSIRLSETENRFQSMADSSPVMLWMAQADSLCTFFNQTWLEFTGKTMEEEWGVGWAAGIHPEDFQRCMDTYLVSFNERKKFQMEYRLMNAEGKYRWILDRGNPRYCANNIFAGFIGSCVDITELKELEINLRHSIRTREEFLSLASHELKTPLTSLVLQLGLFEHLMKSNENKERIFDKGRLILGLTKKQLGRLTELIEGLLDISRIEAGLFHLKLTNVNLADLVNSVIERIQVSIKASGCKLTIDNGNKEAQKKMIGLWDQSKLDQVISNLITNALKYAPESNISIRIYRENQQAVFEIQDTGPGISAEDCRKIFEKFNRANASTNMGGLGLGLYISKEIVTGHQGKITVNSAVGQGAFFKVELPLQSQI